MQLRMELFQRAYLKLLELITRASNSALYVIWLQNGKPKSVISRMLSQSEFHLATNEEEWQFGVLLLWLSIFETRS